MDSKSYQYSKQGVKTKASSVSASDGYFVVGTVKFILMSLFTLGIYHIYWSYKNWKYIKDREHSNIMPFWRAFFLFPIWIFGLGKKIRDHCIEVSEQPNFNHISVGFGYLIFNFWGFSDEIWRLFFSLFAFVPLLILQADALKINQKLGIRADKNSEFNTWNYLFMLLGAFMYAIVISEMT